VLSRTARNERQAVSAGTAYDHGATRLEDGGAHRDNGDRDRHPVWLLGSSGVLLVDTSRNLTIRHARVFTGHGSSGVMVVPMDTATENTLVKDRTLTSHGGKIPLTVGCLQSSLAT
jgi:hypothetical protein